MASKVVQDKATKFSRGHKLHGWELAWLVASCCKDIGQGRPRKGSREPFPADESDGNQAERVTFSEFATLSEVSRTQVSRYYKAWQLAAADGQVPEAERLDPLSKTKPEEIDGLEVIESMAHSWSYYYQAAKYGKPIEDPDVEPEPEEVEPVSKPTPIAGQPAPKREPVDYREPVDEIDAEEQAPEPEPVELPPNTHNPQTGEKLPAPKPSGRQQGKATKAMNHNLGVVLKALTETSNAVSLILSEDTDIQTVDIEQLQQISSIASEIQCAVEAVMLAAVPS